MRILQVSFADINGGAEQVAWDLHQAYRHLGHQSLLVVGHKRSLDQASVVNLVPKRLTPAWFRYRLTVETERHSGIQAMGYWMFDRWWRQNSQEWDIIHLHNLHSSYFDLGVLPQIAEATPVIQTLHDCWQLTGHCAYPILVGKQGCMRWQHGCGKCPDLKAYPSVSRDGTAFNWRRKRRIYTHAQPVLVTPSRWLQSFVHTSLLKELRCELIHNGVDTHRFKSGDQRQARLQLGLPKESKILLYVANGGLKSSLNRDPVLMLETLRKLIQSGNYPNTLLVALGGEETLPKDLAPWIIQRQFLRDNLESYYQAADIYLHATKADNFPMTILEAMASGLPTVTNNVGGCCEQVVEGETGFVVVPGDVEAFTSAVIQLLDRDYAAMGQRASERARSDFSLSKMIENYLALYQDLIDRKG
jgi:glycosyltransferase involved in cell wall biosynthesis